MSAGPVRAARQVLACIQVVVGVAVSFPVLVVARLIVRYNAFSYRGHADRIRTRIPWKASMFIAPMLPLYSFTSPSSSFTHIGEPANTLSTLVWLAGALVLAEIYSVCLHREAWIAAFEPTFIPQDARPLGASPARRDDRRLHFLLRTQIAYSAVLIVVGAAVSFQGPLLVVGVSTLFMAKYFGHAGDDFEVVIHWHMHSHVLAMIDSPRRTRVFEFVMDWVLGPLVGYVPRVYNANHLLLHHPENSGPRDIHSPLPYNRASYLEFCAFAVKMCGSLLFGTDLAFHPRCRGKHRRIVVRAIAFYWIAVVALVWSSRLLGLWLIALALHRAVSATRSQYVWHGLIDPAQAGSPIASTILWVSGAEAWQQVVGNASTAYVPPRDRIAAATLDHEALASVPTPGTDWAFFDNYHLLHHLYPRAHYSAYPALLASTMQDLIEADAVVLDLAGMETFALDCWSGRVDRIASLLLTDMPTSMKDAFIKQRLRPLAEVRAPAGALCATRPVRVLDAALIKALRRLTVGNGK